MAKILIAAPHPDDETLGCGGTLLRHLAEGDEVHWFIISRMEIASGYSEAQISERENVISAVAAAYNFSSVIRGNFAAGQLDNCSYGDIVASFKQVLDSIQADTVYLPYKYDVHSDHGVVFNAMVSASKSFRAPYVRQWLAYETLSETEFALDPQNLSFNPTRFVDISPFQQKKLEICQLYAGEFAAHPFPRSLLAVQAQMLLRGAQAGCDAAEAFVVLKEIR